jgi:hypothetical protein
MNIHGDLSGKQGTILARELTKQIISATSRFAWTCVDFLHLFGTIAFVMEKIGSRRQNSVL